MIGGFISLLLLFIDLGLGFGGCLFAFHCFWAFGHVVGRPFVLNLFRGLLLRGGLQDLRVLFDVHVHRPTESPDKRRVEVLGDSWRSWRQGHTGRQRRLGHSGAVLPVQEVVE